MHPFLMKKKTRATRFQVRKSCQNGAETDILQKQLEIPGYDILDWAFL